MFTGLIYEVGRLVHSSARGGGLQMRIAAPKIIAEAQIGDSIASNGVCLTIEQISGDAFETHAGAETVGLTTLGQWRPGRAINLEPALRPSDRMGGHFVQGHVDCTGVCIGSQQEGDTVYYSFEIPAEHMAYVVRKGSIAVDGISLTVADLSRGDFSVAIIPHTMAHTTLPELKSGDAVNIETDIIAKYVRRLLAGAADTTSGPSDDTIPGASRGAITEDFLREHGFAE